MRRSILLLLFLIGATRAALAVTCEGFSMTPSDGVVVRYNAALPSGATHSTPIASFNGSAIAVSRTTSGGSSIDSTCVDDSVDLGVLSVGQHTVTWTDLVTNPVYEKLGVAPVQIAGQAVIRDGKIKSLITHFPPSSLAKFEQACEQKGCETPKADGVLIVGQPCLRFLANAWAQTRRVTIQ